MIEKSYLLQHICIPITLKNVIVEDTRIMQIQYFVPRSMFYKFFPKLNNLKTYCAYLFWASSNFFEQVNIWYASC